MAPTRRATDEDSRKAKVEFDGHGLVMEHHAHLGVECPQCHGRQFVEVQFDQSIELSPLAREIRAQLEAWLASRCPDHLTVMPRLSKN